MVIRYTDLGWQVITQRAHGIFAAKLAMHWQVKDRPERWLETLLAIAEHDDAEVEIDGENLITPDGGPLNYSMKKFDLSHCNKLSALSTAKSGYIALLTSMHMEFLYGSEIKKNKQAATFLKLQRKIQADLRKQLSISKSKSEKAYALLQWCDAFSLVVCLENFPPENRYIEISAGPGGIMYSASRENQNNIIVEPWPFELSSFTADYEVRVIKHLQFKSSADFREVFLNTQTSQKSWNISGKK